VAAARRALRAGRSSGGDVRRGPSGLAVLGILLIVWLGLPGRALAQDVHLLVVVGVGGSPEHTEKFHKWATAVVDEARKRGVPDANITYLGERTDIDPVRIKARSTRDNMTKTITDIAARTKPEDEVFILLIGHGSFDGSTAAFNLPLQDLTAEQYKPLLDKFGATRVVFVNTASSSGAFLAPLAGPGRTIVTATRTGGERNETRFPEFFVEALSTESADRDRNGRISVEEAFEYAKGKVKEAYEQAGNLLSEHASLDDGAEGKLAQTQFLAPQRSRTAAMATADPALRGLVEERDKLERQIAEHKMRKDRMTPTAYEEELERLLTDLALKTRAIRELEAQQ
jgi:hypothetical protein